ncbi:BAG family molecular chaperone regulator 6 [Cocos nucifera]|uniref:BAG family molecular chaperone regulator 6 n=1 Tax=Cocos nucifera TaxID=13894 RepID=A0A8K0HYS8_COCNU|nr:BAG family molecular chaperone regulator 6 [Cocos nucifera]
MLMPKSHVDFGGPSLNQRMPFQFSSERRFGGIYAWRDEVGPQKRPERRRKPGAHVVKALEGARIDNFINQKYPQTFPHHIPYPYHHYPNLEAAPPQMRVDSSKSPSFGPWPYNGSTSHPNPTECHGCCNYSYSPGYYNFRPPYPHIQPPPQCYHHGPYPLYPDAYPPYFVPHYSFDQSRYDYDKAKSHCCGCPNHKCHWGENTGVKIEEQKLESEPKPQESDSSLIKLPDFPYPGAWVPHNYSKEKHTNKNSESQCGLWNGWIPQDVNSLKGLRQDGDDKKLSQNEQKKSQCPWPIIWMPGYNKPEEVVNDLKEFSTSPKVSEEMPKVKIIPLKFLENENHEEKPGVAEDKLTTRAQREPECEKEMKTKTIPVKQMEESSENEKQHEKSDKKKSSISEQQQEENGVKKPSDGKQSSTVKSSKLPPVCLRVDPLPRRKNRNGTSRSPSPSGLNERGKIYQDNKEQGSTQKEIKEEIPKKKIRVVDVKDKSSNKVGKQERSSQHVVPTILMKDALQKAATEKSSEVYEQRTEDGWGGIEASDGKGVESKDSDNRISDDQEKKIGESRGMEVAEIEKMDARKERRNLSESDAAVLIQSAYRGFEVRRWQPLEKLRKIAQIHEQVEDIKKQIQSFETSSKGQDMKQKVVMSETIMNLLLQLDTIQGLHQSVREVRKSVARELICLQEKLDSLSSHATAEHESSEIGESTSSRAFDHQATCLGSSAAAAEASSEQAYEQLSYQNCTTDFTSREKMQEAEAEDKKDALLVTENQELESVSGETADLLNKEMVPSVNGEHKEARMQEEKQPVSEAVALEESKLFTEEPSLKLEESPASLAFSVKEVPEAPSAAKAEATKLDEEEHLETQRPNCQDFESVKKEMCDYGAQPKAQANLEMEEKGLTQPLEGCDAKEASEIKVEEHEAVSNALEFQEPMPEKDEPDSENGAPITRSIEDDSKEEVLQMLPLPEESDSMEKTAGDMPAYTKEVLNTGRIANAVDFVKTMRGVGESSSEDKAPVIPGHESRTKEEPQMLPVEEGNYFAEAASGDEAAETINIEAACAAAVTPGASEESNDVGSMIEKNLEMQATVVGNMSQDQITVQGGSPESGTENGTDSGAADEVIGRKEMSLAPETHLEATMDKDAPSSLKKIHHKESSHTPIIEAATNEASPPLPEEEGIGVAQPKDSIPMAGLVSIMNLSMEDKLVKENQKLREMLEKLLLMGKEHMGVISNLNGRIEDLEKKMAQKKKKKKTVKVRRHKPAKTFPVKLHAETSCGE